jgi:hypothetical protein
LTAAIKSKSTVLVRRGRPLAHQPITGNFSYYKARHCEICKKELSFTSTIIVELFVNLEGNSWFFVIFVGSNLTL